MEGSNSNLHVLTPDELEMVYTKSYDNAKDLYSDACLLLDNDRIERAQFLFRISSEELGKCALIVIMIFDLQNGRANWSDFWKKFRDHKTKAKYVETLTDYLATSSIRESFREVVDSVIPILERAKMSCLYADFFNSESNMYYNPKELTTRKETECAKFLAERSINIIGSISIHDLVNTIAI